MIFPLLFSFAICDLFSPDPLDIPIQKTGEGVCLYDRNASPVVLAAQPYCPLHFYCPNVNPLNPISAPQMCPPTLDCQKLRLTSNFCPPQGMYEPVPCPRGYYCPDYLTKLPCPEGFYCPTGTSTPRPCTMPFSSCPTGSAKQRYFGGIIYALIIDLALTILYLFIRFGWKKRIEKKLDRELDRQVFGRQIGTISTSRHNKKSAQFMTLEEDNNDQEEDEEDPDDTNRSILYKTFSWRFYVKRLKKLFSIFYKKYFKKSKAEKSAAMKMLQIKHMSMDGRDLEIVTDSDPQTHHQASKHQSAMPKPSTNLQFHYNVHLNDLLLGFRKAQNGQDLSLHFEFNNLSLKLPNGQTILNGVTGHIVPGKVTVIMGPSGAGKSTFMNVLMGKTNRTGGKLLINGKEVEMHLYKKIIGYVPQDDVMLMELTVRENIAYSAHTRLPRSWKSKEIEDFVDTVIAALDLSHISHNLITSISGGQRKRVNIGMELVTCPSAIFLDEPTSGLDSTAALKVASTMKRIAMTIGINVVAVIHQPRYEIFTEFDDLLMIAPGGVTCYLGSREGVIDYFEKLNFYFNPQHNPADDLMDILSGKGTFKQKEHEDAPAPEYEVQDLVEAWSQYEQTLFNTYSHQNYKLNTPCLPDEPPPPEPIFTSEFDAEPDFTLPQKRKDSAHTVLDISSNSVENDHIRLKQACFERGSPSLVQMFAVHRRSLLQQYRKVNGFILEILIATISGMLMGLAVTSYDGVLYQGLLVFPFTLLSPSPIEVVVPILALIVSCAVGLSGAPAAVKIFSEEREIYWREASSGHSPLAYYLGKNIASTYRYVIAALHFSSFFHYFACPNIAFYRIFIIHLFMFFCVYGISFMIGMLVKRENASMSAVCLMVVFSVLSGGGPNVNDMQSYHLEWLLDISFARWSTEAWYSQELIVFDNVYEIDNISSKIFGYTLRRYWFDIIMTVLLGFCWRIIAFLLLIGLNRQKQK